MSTFSRVRYLVGRGSLLALMALLGVSATRGQDFLWVRQLGGDGFVLALDVALDGSGNVHTVGCFGATADFDPGPGTANLTATGVDGLQDAFVSKLDSAGKLVWARQLGGTDFDEAVGVAVDGNGNVYTVGFFGGTADFDPGPGTADLTTNGSNDAFVSKLDSAGNFVWARQLGGTGSDDATSVVIDGSGNVYAVGHFRGTVDFDPGPGTTNQTARGRGDAFVWKLDSGGDLIWARQMGGTDTGGFGDRATSVTLDTSDNVYTTGRFRGTADFDPGAGTAELTSAGGDDVFVSKLDSAGNFVWARHMGGTGGDVGGSAGSLAVDASGNVYTVGSFVVTADFDPGVGTAELTAAGGNDGFISKLDSAGNYVWAHRVGGSPSNDRLSSVTLDGSGDVYSVGTFSGTVDFDPGPDTANLTSAGLGDAFVWKLDGAGNYVWARRLGGTDTDGGRGIALDGSAVYTVGSFSGTADFDPGPGSAELTAVRVGDVFISQLGPGLVLDVDGDLLTWGPAGGAVSYDIVRGDLTTLRSSGGDFIQATDECLANDHPATSLIHTLSPQPQEGYWFLVRRVTDAGGVSYDIGADSQVPERDDEIAASGVDCP